MRAPIGVLVVVFCILTAAAPSDAAVQLVSADDDRIVFELDLSDYRLTPSGGLAGTQRLEVPGFGGHGEPGQPGIPRRRFLVALPPGGGYSVGYRVLESEVLGTLRLEPVPYPLVIEHEDGTPTSTVEYRFDEDVYNSGGSSVRVEADPEARLRHQRVVPVAVSPLTYDPRTGDAVLAKRIRIEVTLRSGPAGAKQSRPASEIDVWERVYTRSLVNPGQARAWRSRPVVEAGSRVDSRTRAITAGPLVKLAVRKTGMHRVRAADVIAKGFPAGTPTDQLHVFKRHYDDSGLAAAVTDVAYDVVEGAAGQTGLFDSDDYVIFYGQQLREDPLQGDAIEKFSAINVYWLGATAGATMAPKSVAAASVSPDTSTAAFPVSAYFEEDLFFFEETPPNIREFYYYNVQFNSSYQATFSLGPIDPSSTFTVKASFMGADPNDPTRTVQVAVVNSNGTTQLDNAIVPNKQVVQYESTPVSSSVLVPGVNRLRISRSPNLLVVLDYFTVEYDAPYRTRGNVLSFNVGSLAASDSLTIVGLNRKDVMLFDVTDPYQTQKCLLDDSHFTDVPGGGYALSFRGTFTGSERYVLAPLDGITEITGNDIIEDEPSTLIGHPLESGVDVLVVSHEMFLDEMQRWVDYRRGQGYRVLMADVTDVYDEFNGGVPNARAIRRFTNHFYQTGSAAVLVLVGDSSEDNKRVHVESNPSFVPSESFTEHVSSSVFNEDEVVTTDKYFVMLTKDIIYDPTATQPSDYFSDLLVGRFPVGTVDELRIMLDKTIAYEQPSADDFWRRRMIRVADDRWSGGNQLCQVGSEAAFEAAEAAAAVITENSMPGGYDIVRFYLQNRINHPSGCVNAFSQCQVTRADGTPVLMNELNQGATLVSINAHMNRYLICHEWLLTSSRTITPTPDPMLLQNYGKPFILFGLGCHLSDYALHKERARANTNPPNGDCFSEIALFAEDRGAVCTWASTGFEYLNTNANYTRVVADAFFTTPPSNPVLPDNKNQVRWIMGEVMLAAEIDNLMRYPSGGAGDGSKGQAKRYHILGDPLLRIDAGPPRFDVTVDGQPVQSGDEVSAEQGDSISVVATVTDEVAIERVSVIIDDVNVAASITPLLDAGMDAARSYQVTFGHKLVADTYDIVIRAEQAADTTGTYHVVADFELVVNISVELRVNGRPIVEGDFVPASGDYVFEIGVPVEIDPAIIRVEVDGTEVPNLMLANPSPDETTTWLASFSLNLANGSHTATVFVDQSEFPFTLNVGSQVGLRDLFAYPNPYVEDTYFVYSNDIEITNGSITIFTSSGKRIRTIEIPSEARAVGQNAVHWDGRTGSGGSLANGVYLYVINVKQNGSSSVHRGKLVKAQ